MRELVREKLTYLLLEWLNMVEVDMCIPKRVNKVPRLREGTVVIIRCNSMMTSHLQLKFFS